EMPTIAGVRVLIVDDDRESCEAMSEALQTHGVTVRAAFSASEAVDALRDFRPDVVVSDLAMPGRDGFAVLDEIRASQTRSGRRTPGAAVIAYARSEDRDRVITAGFDEYVVKPVDPRALVLVVGKLVAGVGH